MKQNGKYADVNGLHMYYEVHGAGKPLVLIHGAASTIQTTFGRLLPAFSNGGTTALQMAIRHPAMVNRLIIASSMYKRAGVRR